MNTQRILTGTAWIVSVVAAYFIGTSGSSPQSLASSQQSDKSGAAAAGNQSANETKSDRTYLRKAGDLPEEEKKDKPNVAALIARARVEFGSGMNGMMNFRGMLRAMAPLAELDESQLQEALAEVEKSVKEPQQKMMFYSMLLGQWAETDGKAALAYAEEKMPSKGPFDMGIRAAVLGAWSRSEPDAAWRWYQTERKDDGNEQSSQMMLSMIFAGMASRNLDTAIQRLEGLDDRAMAMAINGIAGSAHDETSRKRLLERAASLPKEQRQKIQSPIASQWAMSDPEAAMKWIRSLPQEDQKQVRESAGSMMLMTRPDVAADFMLEGAADEKDRARIYDRVAGQWGYQNPKATGEWLAKQPQGPELDGARRTYAMVVAQKDPAAAMDWAKSVHDAEQRTQSVEQIFHTWRGKDAAAAEAALDAAGLPPEKVKQLKETKTSGSTNTQTRVLGF